MVPFTLTWISGLSATAAVGVVGVIVNFWYQRHQVKLKRQEIEDQKRTDAINEDISWREQARQDRLELREEIRSLREELRLANEKIDKQAGMIELQHTTILHMQTEALEREKKVGELTAENNHLKLQINGLRRSFREMVKAGKIPDTALVGVEESV